MCVRTPVWLSVHASVSHRPVMEGEGALLAATPRERQRPF